MVSLSNKGKFMATVHKRSRPDKVVLLTNYKDALGLGLAWLIISAEHNVLFFSKSFHLKQHSLHGRSCGGNPQHISSIAYRTHEETSNMGPKTKIMKALEWGISIN